MRERTREERASRVAKHHGCKRAGYCCLIVTDAVNRIEIFPVLEIQTAASLAAQQLRLTSLADLAIWGHKRVEEVSVEPALPGAQPHFDHVLVFRGQERQQCSVVLPLHKRTRIKQLFEQLQHWSKVMRNFYQRIKIVSSSTTQGFNSRNIARVKARLHMRFLMRFRVQNAPYPTLHECFFRDASSGLERKVWHIFEDILLSNSC